MNYGLFKNVTFKLFTCKSYKHNLALNNPQRLICHKTQLESLSSRYAMTDRQKNDICWFIIRLHKTSDKLTSENVKIFPQLNGVANNCRENG